MLFISNMLTYLQYILEFQSGGFKTNEFRLSRFQSITFQCNESCSHLHVQNLITFKIQNIMAVICFHKFCNNIVGQLSPRLQMRLCILNALKSHNCFQHRNVKRDPCGNRTPSKSVPGIPVDRLHVSSGVDDPHSELALTTSHIPF